MEISQELNIIKQIRGEVHNRKELTGENLFLAWGYPTAIGLFIEFLALQLWHEDWCSWLWMGIPLVGTPLMIYFLNEAYERTGCRTLEQNVILMMWIFVGFASCVGGAAMGFVGIFPQCYCAYQGLLIGFSCFMTGIIASFLSVVPLFLQGDLWPWQLLIASIIAVIALIIPGHLFRRHVRNYYSFNS